MKNRSLSIMGLILLWINGLFLSTDSFAQISEINQLSLMPIEWQAIKLQESIESKIIRSLTPIVNHDDYVIEVKIGFDSDRAEDPSSKKTTKMLQKAKIKFSTTDMPKDGDDFVVFNKLGIEAPVIGDEEVEIQTSEIEQAQKAMIEMNDRFNIFKFLNTIDIKLTFDKSLSNNTKENIQKIISGLSFNTKDVVPQVNLQYLDLSGSKVKNSAMALESISKKEKQNNKIEPKTPLIERFKNLDIMIGIIVASLILGIAAFIIARVNSKEGHGNKNEEVASIEEKNIEPEGHINQDENGNEESDEDFEEDDMGSGSSKLEEQNEKIKEGLERFHKAMNNHYNDSILMIKNWIKIGKGKEAEALKALVEVLTDTELKDIFKALTLDERSTWKMCLDGEMRRAEIARAFIYIGHQVVNMMMVPSLIDDYETCVLLLDLTPEDAANLCMKHKKLGTVFVNVLSSSTISEMFKIVPHDKVVQIIESSSAFNKDEILNQMPILKQELLEIKARREKPPFVKRIIDILPSASPDIERMLYGTLLTYLLIEDVRDIAIRYIPTEIVDELPDHIYKDIVSTLPLDFQVQYFISLGDNREVHLSRYAVKGSKSREMIDVEMSGILKNDLLVQKLTGEKKAKIRAEFVSAVRIYLGSNTEAQQEAISATFDWLKNIKNESSVAIGEAA